MQVIAVKYYVDTAVWRDYFEDRSDGLQPLGEFAFRFLKKCQEKKHKILFSRFVVNELLKYYSKERVGLVFAEYKDNLVEVRETREIVENAVKLREKLKVSFVDCVHALLAKENNAIIVSRDRHFQKLENIANARLPEELI